MGFPWTVPVLLLAAAILVVVLQFGRQLFPGTYVSRLTFWCPFRSMNVGVDFETATWDGCHRDVKACSAFSSRVACEKGCLSLRTFPPVKSEMMVTIR
jgi:hypothetical protein